MAALLSLHIRTDTMVKYQDTFSVASVCLQTRQRYE